MSIRSTLKYLFTPIFSLLLLCLAIAAHGQATADTTSAADTAVEVHKIDSAGHQLCIGVDIVRPIENAFVSDRIGYEFQADYYLHNELYLAAEGGWGSSTVTYTDLKYNTRNTFYRLGFNKILLARENKKDWGGMFMGLRLAMAPISRSAANYTVIDSVWGNGSGSLGPKEITSFWMEVTGGVRVELVKGLMAGWNIRGKFMLNNKQLKDLAPLYIAGYGRGDKNAVFDFNFYLSYAIRWKRNFPQPPANAESK